MSSDQQPATGAEGVSETVPFPGDPGNSGNSIDVLDFALLFVENLKLLVFVPLAAGLIALGIGFYTVPTYTAVTSILPPQQQQNASAALAAQLGGALAGLAGATGLATKNPADQYVAFIRSRKIAEAMIARFQLKERWGVQFDADARRHLEGVTRATTSTKDGLIVVEVDDEDPKRAADMANAYVEELRTLVSTLALTEPAQRRVFFDAQLKLAKDNLTKAEIALRSSGINETAIKVMPQSAILNLARIKAMVTAQEIKLAMMRTSMTDSNPAYFLAREELTALRAELAKEERTETVPTSVAGVEYISKARDFKYYETLFELMARQYEVARIDEARDGMIIQVLDLAKKPERKSKPKKAQNAVLATLATFFALVLFVLLRHWLKKASRDGASAQKMAQLARSLPFRRN